MKCSKKSTSSQGSYRRSPPWGATAIIGAAVLTLGGCAVPAPQAAAKPERAYVGVETLVAAHPLAASLRDLDAAAQRLRGDAAVPARVGTPEVFAPILSDTPTRSGTDAKRNADARLALRRSAETTLTRYVATIAAIGARIRVEKRAEFEGIASARGADREAAARTRIENETRDAIVSRSDAARQARIRRDAAKLNLSNQNVVSVARDPVTKLPSDKRLEEQIAALSAHAEKPPPRPTPFVTSDEARLTKLLRDWEKEVNRIRDANDRDVTFNNGLIADAIATIRAENDEWVRKQLAKLPADDGQGTEIAALRRELLALLQDLEATERVAARAAMADGAGARLPPLPAVAPVMVTRPDSDAVYRQIVAERADIRDAIRRDVVAAVRDAGQAHNVEPVFSPAPNLPDRTPEFRRWIFGNVDTVPLSNQAKPR